MRHIPALYLLRSVAWVLLAAGVAGCSENDPNPVNAIGVVQGVFKDPGGSPIANAPVELVLTDSASAEVGRRALATNAAGQFSTRFDLPPTTFPVSVQFLAQPPIGSGMGDFFSYDNPLALSPGRLTGTLTYDINAIQVEPSVNNVAAAPLAQDALLGRYSGATVPPYGPPYYIIIYLDLDITGTAGSVSGRYDIDYNAPVVTPDGTILGAVLLDTLRLQFTGDTVPGEPRKLASFKAIATSSTADTLIAWPDPCTPDCWLNTAPLRLVRVP